MRASREAKVLNSGSWLHAAFVALLGWLLVVLALAVGVRPLGLVLLAAAAATTAASALYAHATARQLSEFVGFSFACTLLEWPLLGLVTLLILSWAGAGRWG